MQSIDFVVESKLVRTPRVMQLEGMFDVPAHEKLAHRWQGEVPLDERDWNVGLIVGPSGAGKSSVMRQLFGQEQSFVWLAPSVVDDFSKALPIAKITEACSAVGFNTIPSWMKPYSVLSNGEKFRVELARALLERPDPIVIDEFTSVVDRQVAQIGSHAVQKFIRKNGRKFVGVSCHYDIEEWLQPDWVLEPATMTFRWRSVQRRPAIDTEICRCDYETWRVFAPYHYLTAELHHGSQCFGLFVEGRVAAFAAVLHRPHPKVKNLKGVSRLVTLPDYQGLGLAFVLVDALGAAYSSAGQRLHTYPAHPSLVRAFDRSPAWSIEKKPGQYSGLNTNRTGGACTGKTGKMGGRPCAVFRYVGAAMEDIAVAQKLING